MPTSSDLWAFLPWDFLITVSIETPVLLVGLSARHDIQRRLFSGVWLTACSYPTVVLLLPFLVWEPFGHMAYLIVAETFAPLSECLLFYLAFDRPARTPSREAIRNALVIVAANLLSFMAGEVMTWLEWIG
jgi:hypothetical protein